ncbi:MAG: DUF1465 family protein [Rhizobiaceae bacterium]
MDNEQTVQSAQSPVRLAQHFADSNKFRELFSYGMDLVEETATFLDTDGRQAAKTLSKPAQSVYGAESMRLTTRLMQLASWLLLQRAVAEGEMTVEQAISEKKNVKLNQLQPRKGGPGWDDLPEDFLSLVDRSVALQRRIKRLDDEIYNADKVEVEAPKNHVASQRALLETAFDRRFGS